MKPLRAALFLPSPSGFVSESKTSFRPPPPPPRPTPSVNKLNDVGKIDHTLKFPKPPSPMMIRDRNNDKAAISPSVQNTPNSVKSSLQTPTIKTRSVLPTPKTAYQQAIDKLSAIETLSPPRQKEVKAELRALIEVCCYYL
jgi:hypothetical protein